MADNQLRINGLDELRQALRALPSELVHESAEIVQAQASEAYRQMAAAYPVRTGNLSGGLRLDIRRDAVSSGATVRNIANFRRGPYRSAAWFFEKGTKPRRWASGKETGAMAARPVMIPIAIRRRAIMEAALIDLVKRAGLTVTGTA